MSNTHRGNTGSGLDEESKAYLREIAKGSKTQSVGVKILVYVFVFVPVILGVVWIAVQAMSRI